MSSTTASTRRSLDQIPGFNDYETSNVATSSRRTRSSRSARIALEEAEEDIERDIEDQEIEEDAEALGIESSTIRELEAKGYNILDILLVDEEDSEGELTSPFLKLENSKQTVVYAKIDTGVTDIMATTGTAVFRLSETSSPVPYSYKKRTLNTNEKSIVGSAVVCDQGGVCFLQQDQEGEPTEAYFTPATVLINEEGYEEKAKSVHPVVSLKDILENSEKVDADIATTVISIRNEFSTNCHEIIVKTRVLSETLIKDFKKLEDVSSTRFTNLEKNIRLLENIISDYNRSPPEDDKQVYQKTLAENELKIRKNQFEQLVLFCEDSVSKLYQYISRIDDKIESTISVLVEDDEQSGNIHLQTLNETSV